MDLQLRQYCQRRRAAMHRLREPWLTDWRQVSEYVDPSRGQFDEVGTGNRTDRRRSTRSRAKIINNTATRCVRVMSAGMASHMTSKSRPWFSLSPPDPGLQEMFDVRVWMDDVTQLIRDTLAKSNFYKAISVLYTEDAMFGVAVMMALEDEDEVIRFSTLTAGTYALSLDGNGKVDGLHRQYPRTARALVERYGYDKVPQTVQLAVGTKDQPGTSPDREFMVESLIEKNPEQQPGMGRFGLQAAKNRPWREVVWIQGVDADQHGCLDIGGHYEAPFVAVRWNPVGDDVYSTSPCIDSLGDIKQLQYLEGKKLQVIDITAEPPLGVPEQLRNQSASLRPGSKTYLPMTQTGSKAEPLYVPNPRAVPEISAEIREVESRIEDANFYNLFLMMESLGDSTGRTATEIAERREEKATVLGPTLEAVTDEALDPVVIRTYRLLERRGLIPPAPEALDKVPLKIEYTSILAQAQKASGLASIERMAGFVGNMVKLTGNMDVLDKFDTDQAIDAYGERVGGPAELVRSDEAVAAMRNKRASDAQQAKLMAAAPAMADAAGAIKTLGEAVPQEGSVGQGIAEQMMPA